MIDFSRSTFTWQSHPWTPDPNYRWAGGFVGEPGQVYHVRFTLDARCQIDHPDADSPVEFFLGSPCRAEYTIARRNLFQIPSDEWRMVFSEQSQLSIVPSDRRQPGIARPLKEAFADFDIDIRHHDGVQKLRSASAITDATLAKSLLNGVSRYLDERSGCTITVEFPVNVMNLNPEDGEWQICTGPLIIPDLDTWDGMQVGGVYLAHVALSAFDHVEFILRRHVDVSETVAKWLDTPVGRDRLELYDPANPPPGYPPERPRPKVYHDVCEHAADNLILAAN